MHQEIALENELINNKHKHPPHITFGLNMVYRLGKLE